MGGWGAMFDDRFVYVNMVCLLLSRSVIAQPLAVRDAFITELM